MINIIPIILLLISMIYILRRADHHAEILKDSEEEK